MCYDNSSICEVCLQKILVEGTLCERHTEIMMNELDEMIDESDILTLEDVMEEE